MKGIKRYSKDIRRLETNEGVRKAQQLCAKDDLFFIVMEGEEKRMKTWGILRGSERC